ncbi:MAG: hypothetical protein QXP49_06995 [Nitrososphaerota archaeon]
MRDELLKYIVRLIVAIAIITLISWVFTGVMYGVFMKMALGIVLAESIWALWFKPSLGRLEAQSNERFLGVAVLRAVLLGSCIIGACLGL